MGNTVNYIHATNFISLLDTPVTKETMKIRQNPEKMGLRFFTINFHGCFSFILSQNGYDALILDHL